MARFDGALVRVRNLGIPPALREMWPAVVDEMGDLVVARIVGRDRELVIDVTAVRQLKRLINDLLDDESQLMDWCGKPEDWRGGEPEDDRTFGPDPEAWKQ